MKLIPTKIHGILDYLTGILLIASPWLFGFSNTGNAMLVPVVLGVITIIYSLLTRYELGAAPVLPMGAHLVLDFLSGVFLLASPWLLGFSGIIVWPHVAVGLFEIVVSLITQRSPSALYTEHRPRISHA